MSVTFSKENVGTTMGNDDDNNNIDCALQAAATMSAPPASRSAAATTTAATTAGGGGAAAAAGSGGGSGARHTLAGAHARVGSYLEDNLFDTTEMTKFLSARDLNKFLCTNKKIRDHHLGPNGEIARRKKRFREIKVEIARLLDTFRVAEESLYRAHCLRAQAEKLIGFDPPVCEADVQKHMIANTENHDRDHYVCPYCSRDSYFYEERRQLQPHFYSDLVEAGPMLPNEFYRLEMDSVVVDPDGMFEDITVDDAFMEAFHTMFEVFFSAVSAKFPSPSSRFWLASVYNPTHAVVVNDPLWLGLVSGFKQAFNLQLRTGTMSWTIFLHSIFTLRCAAKRYAQQEPELIPALCLLLSVVDMAVCETLEEFFQDPGDAE